MDQGQTMKRNKGFRIGIRSKAVALILLTTISTVSIGLGLGYFWGYRLLRATLEEEHGQMAEMLALSVRTLIEREVRRLETLMTSPARQRELVEANLKYEGMDEEEKLKYFKRMDNEWVAASDSDPLVRGYLEEEASIRFRALVADSRNIMELFITDKAGGLLAASQKTSDFYQGDEKWWQGAFNNGKGDVFVGDVTFDRSVGKLGITFAVPIRHEGETIGVCKAVLHVSSFFRSLEEFKILGTGHAVLIDRTGSIIFHHGIPPMTMKVCDEKNLQKLVKGPKKSILIKAAHIHKRDIIATVTEVKDPYLSREGERWWVLIDIEKQEVFAPLNRLIHQMMLVVLILGLVTLLLGIVFSGIFVKPIQELSVAAKEVGKGDLDYEIKVRSGDEIGELAGAFRTMLLNLKYKQAELTYAKEQLLEGARSLEMRVKKKTKDLLRAQEATLNIMEDLEESKTYIENIVANFLDTLVVADLDGMIKSVNQVAVDLTGYQEKELVGRPFGTIFADEKEGKVLVDGFMQNLGEKETYKLLNYETSYKKKDGTGVPVLLSGATMLDKDGKPIGIVIVAKDITMRRKAEEALRLGQLGKLVADMAHEVNNPLMIISGRAQISLMQGVGEKERKENAKIVMDQCRRAREVIQRLLMFSKPDRGQAKKTDMNKVINFVIKIVEHQFSIDNIKIRKKYCRPLPTLNVNAGQLHEVIMNLFKNAAEAMPEGGTITVVTASEGNNIRIEITDTGQGIEMKDLMRIFDPFFTTKEKGTGLGLSVCYGIIKVYGGDMKCMSRPGEGTTMTILLPIAEQIGTG